MTDTLRAEHFVNLPGLWNEVCGWVWWGKDGDIVITLQANSSSQPELFRLSEQHKLWFSFLQQNQISSVFVFGASLLEASLCGFLSFVPVYRHAYFIYHIHLWFEVTSIL